MRLKQGINLGKLDKKVLIFNYKKDEGYKVLTIDSNKYDARYWMDYTLGLDHFEDKNFYTKKHHKFCQDFSKNVVLPGEDKKEEVMSINRPSNYFAKNEKFEETNSLNEIIDNPDQISEFKIYKVDQGEKYRIEDTTSFPVSKKAVTEARRKFKNLINLNSNITIKLDFVSPESADKFLKKGWDKEKQIKY